MLMGLVLLMDLLPPHYLDIRLSALGLKSIPHDLAARLATAQPLVSLARAQWQLWLCLVEMHVLGTGAFFRLAIAFATLVLGLSPIAIAVGRSLDIPIGAVVSWAIVPLHYRDVK